MIPLQGSALVRAFVDEAIRLNGRIAALEAEVSFLRLGVELYRDPDIVCRDGSACDDDCDLCAWEREARAREEYVVV